MIMDKELLHQQRMKQKALSEMADKLQAEPGDFDGVSIASYLAEMFDRGYAAGKEMFTLRDRVYQLYSQRSSLDNRETIFVDVILDIHMIETALTGSSPFFKEHIEAYQEMLDEINGEDAKTAVKAFKALKKTLYGEEND